jgi:hypothetical protein
MISETSVEEIDYLKNIVEEQRRHLGTYQASLLGSLRRAKENGATYAELASLLGVSRQRVHQMLKEEG